MTNTPNSQSDQRIVVEPICTNDGGDYTVTINVQSLATNDKLGAKLQAAYDQGAAGSFEIHPDANGRQIIFTRSFSDDYEMLLARMKNGQSAYVAARTQLADEFEEAQAAPDCLTAVINALRDQRNGVVVGLAETQAAAQTTSQTYSSLLNDAQKAVLQKYAGGEFAHICDVKTEHELKQELKDCGDSLLRFLMVELSSSEDCNSLQEAQGRIESAMRDLQIASDAIYAAEIAESTYK